MSNPFLGEIRIVGFYFAPVGWAMCNGQLLSISQNMALFSLLGTTYGGDGQTTFALPNLQGRFAMHQSPSGPIGENGGAATISMTTAHLPAHAHTVRAVAGAGNAIESTGNYLAGAPPQDHQGIFSGGGPAALMAPGMIQPSGQGQPIGILPPYLTLNFIIAIVGIFPSQS
jgi:microcystin-dependent protein